MRYVFLVPAASAGGIQINASRYATELRRRGEDVLVVLWRDVSLPYSAKERGLFADLLRRQVTFDGLSQASTIARELSPQLGLQDRDCVVSQALPCIGHVMRRERRDKEVLHIERLPGDVEDFYVSAVRLAATCDLYLSVSRRIAGKLRPRLEEAGAQDIPVAVCSAGIEVPPDYPEREGHDPFRICFVGRLSREKRIPDLPRIGRRLAEEGVRFEFSVIGTGGQEATLCRQLHELGLEEQFHLLGNRPHQEVLALLPQHHAFVLTSAYEGFPNSLCEAMAYGLVPVTSRVSGAEDVIRDGENGFLADVDDVETMASRLRSLARDPDRWRTLSRAAYETAREELSIGARVGVFLRAVDDAWAGRARRAGRKPGPLRGRSVLEHPWLPNIITRLVRRAWRGVRGRPPDAAPRRKPIRAGPAGGRSVGSEGNPE